MGSRTAPDKAMPQVNATPGEVVYVRIVPHYRHHDTPKARPAVVLRVKKRGARAVVLPLTSRRQVDSPAFLADRGIGASDLTVTWWNYEKGRIVSWIKSDLGPVDVHASAVTTLVGEVEAPGLEQLREWAPVFAEYAHIRVHPMTRPEDNLEEAP